MRSYAVLLDVGFLRKKLGTKAAPLTADMVEAFVSDLQSHDLLKGLVLHRVYAYDAKPLEQIVARPIDQQSTNLGLSDMAKAGKSLHHGLSTKPFFALRFGELAMHGWRVKGSIVNNARKEFTVKADDLVMDIKQKGVDMRIGMDVAALALKKQVQIIVLVTADSDFVPAMKFARREGLQVFICSLGHGVQDQLVLHSDAVMANGKKT